MKNIIKSYLRPFKVRTKDVLAHLFYTMLFLSYRKKKRNTKYYCSICAIFKDESLYLKEWIEYHLMIGFDHLYLYNNFSSDSYLEVLRPYIDKGLVTLTEWPIKYGQISAYEDCANKYRNENHWIMFLDIDEFVCPREETDIKKWLKRFERYPAVKMYWLMFGTNGLIEGNPNKLVIEQYICSWDALRSTGKVIWNTDFEPAEVYHEHLFCYYKIFGLTFRLPMINEALHFINYSTAEKLPKHNTIQINHYWSKSMNEYLDKINKGDVYSEDNDTRRHKLDFFYWHEHHNVREEKTIFRFLAELKVRMGFVDLRFSRNDVSSSQNNHSDDIS